MVYPSPAPATENMEGNLMTINIPASTITAAARTGDPEAIDQILDAMEPHIAEMARAHANSTGGDFDEMSHAARIAVCKLACEWGGAADEFVTHATRAC